MKSRLAVLAAMTGLAFTSPVSADDKPAIAMLLAGKIDDNGFMEAGYNGLLAAKYQFGVETTYIDGVKPEKEQLKAALRQLAEGGADLVIAHGGQNNEAAAEVAAEFPDTRFAVVQGAVSGPNLASYDVLQEQSAFLAGAAAGLLTKSGVVGHISGIRVKPGLKGRGAFWHGLMQTRPDARFLTTFAGDQDDNALSARVAKMEMDEGADIVFTMLNAGRKGAIDAMRGTGVRQIGNVIDWTKSEPDVFVASAVANVSIPAVEATRDLIEAKFPAGEIRKIGLENPQAVAVTLADDVPQDVRDKVEALRQQIVEGKIEVMTDYEGPEIQP